MKGLILAVDFDGTCVEHEYPQVGPDVPLAETTLKMLSEECGCKIILWTMRHDKGLEDAVKWFEDRGITLYGINENPHQSSWTGSPKAYAHMYIDDAAYGCPLCESTSGGRPYVDWQAIADAVRAKINNR